MSPSQQPLGKHLPPKLTEARLARQYAHVAARVRPARSRSWIGMTLATGALMALLALWITRRPTAMVSLSDGTVLESAPEGAAPAVTLADGSRLALGARSRVRLASTRADAIRIDLERGRIDVAATHAPGRTFVVAAHGYDVTVVGTRFVVEILPDERVDVRVDEGRVQVRSPRGEMRAVSAGESWSETARDAGDAAAAPSSLAVDDDGADEGDASAPRAPRSPGKSAGGKSAPAADDAKALLEKAQQATAEGRMADAAQLFVALRRQHRRDARAALAAFELGRIRLDSLGDPAGAEEAFRDALRLTRGGPLREDAEARRVEALSKMHAAGCAKARDEYLARYANGVHRAAVAGWCAPK
jgi:transmembrane sensor